MEHQGRPRHLDPAKWTNRGVTRDTTIRKLVDQADANAAWLRSQGLSLTEADEVFAAEWGICARTLRAYRKVVEAGGSFAETRGRKRGATDRPIGSKAAALFWRLDRNPGSKVRHNYNKVKAAAAGHAGDPAWHWPSETTARRWLKREHPDFYRARYRKGVDYWRTVYEPKMDRAPLDLQGNEVWEFDASKCNFFAQHRGRKCRLVYELVIDVGTRTFTGHSVAVSENTELVVRALRRAGLRYGSPLAMRTDQGKANRGAGVGDVDREKLTGIVADMRSELQLMPGRSGWAKGPVESAVNVVSMGFDPLFGKAYCGNRPENRIRGVDEWCDKHLHELPTLQEVDRQLGQFLEAQNARRCRDLGGLSPRQKMNQSEVDFRKVPEAALGFSLLRAQRARVTNRGIAVRAGRGTIYVGQGDQRAWELIGQEVILRIDDDDLGQVLVCDKTGRPLFYALNDHTRGMGSDQLREAGKRKQRARKAIRTHWEHVEVASRPTVDEMIRLEREAAEMDEAKEPAPAAGERGLVILHNPHEAPLKEAQKQRLQATGTDDGAPEITLTDLDFRNPVREDQHDDPWQYYGK